MKKILNAADLENAIKQLDKEETRVAYIGDLEVHVRDTISLKEYVEFINIVYGACCDESTGVYKPEIYEVAFLIEFVDYFTDIELPLTEPDVAYNIICGAELEKLLKLASHSQITDLERAIERKIQFFEQKQVCDINNQASRVVNLLEELVNDIGKSFESINPEEISRLFDSIQKFASDDKKILRAVMNSDK